MDQVISPAMLWKRFEAAIRRDRVITHDVICPGSHLLMRLPISRTVMILPTFNNKTGCVHAEEQLIEKLREEFDAVEVNKHPKYVARIYYTNYSICGECITKLAEFRDEMQKNRIPLTLKVHVYMVAGPKNKSVLYESAKDWWREAYKRHSLCLLGHEALRFFKFVLSLLIDYSIQTRHPVKIRCTDDIEFKYLRKRLQLDKLPSETAEPTAPILRVNLADVAYAVQRRDFAKQQIEGYIHIGKDLHAPSDVLGKFICVHRHWRNMRRNEFCEHVYEELAVAVTSVNDIPRWIYHCHPYDGHIEQRYIRYLRNFLEWSYLLPEIIIWQNLMPCYHCAANVLIPFVEEISNKNRQLQLRIKVVEFPGAGDQTTGRRRVGEVFQMLSSHQQIIVEELSLLGDDWEHFKQVLYATHNCWPLDL